MPTETDLIETKANTIYTEAITNYLDGMPQWDFKISYDKLQYPIAVCVHDLLCICYYFGQKYEQFSTDLNAKN